MEDATRHAQGHNPLCGDRVTIFVRMAGDKVEDVSFQGSGCAISKASASLMTDALKGATVAEVDALFEQFQSMVTSAPDADVDLDSVGQAGGVLGRQRVPVARQVREPRVARPARGAEDGRGDRLHRVDRRIAHSTSDPVPIIAIGAPDATPDSA